MTRSSASSSPEQAARQPEPGGGTETGAGRPLPLPRPRGHVQGGGRAGTRLRAVRAVREGREPEVRPLVFVRSAERVRAWMLVLPLDVLALAAPALWMPEHEKAFLLMAVVGLVLLTGGGRYRARLHASVLDEFPSIVGRLLAAGGIVATLFALSHDSGEVIPFLVNGLAAMGLLLLGRVLVTQAILLGRRRRLVAHRTVIVGGGVRATELLVILDRYPQYGLFPVGFVDDHDDVPAAAVGDRLGAVPELDDVVHRTAADVIIVAGDISESVLFDVLRRPSCARCDLLVVPRLQQFCRQVGLVDHIGSIPIMRVRAPRLSGPAWGVKRAADVVVSAVGLVVATPALLVCALAVRVEGGRGVLFRQPRVGRDGAEFTCLKFRTMRPTSSEESATQWSIARDHRVGPVGRFLRRTSLDELPQLWNILRGDMTLVGPRPERPHFVHKFTREVPGYGHRHRVQAGLTGLAQVSGLRGDVPIVDRARFDNYYIENWSLWLDTKILLRTVGEIFFARGR